MFTPTYNRAHTLRRVHASLLAQAPQLFEWLVVDDGSSDSTPALLEELTNSSPFAVRVIRQENAGKHAAHNRAVAVATGELTVVLDSDDELVPGALEALWSAWRSIPETERARYSGVMGNSIDDSGRVVGSPFPADVVDGHFLVMVANGTIVGDKMPCYRTDVLREFPFPAESRREMIPEGTAWSRIGRKYLVRGVNTPVLRIHAQPADADSLMVRMRAPGAGAFGRRLYALTVLEQAGGELLAHPLFLLRHAVIVVRMSLHLGEGPGRQFGALPNLVSRFLWAVALPVGVAAWLGDRRKTRAQ